MSSVVVEKLIPPSKCGVSRLSRGVISLPNMLQRHVTLVAHTAARWLGLLPGLCSVDLRAASPLSESFFFSFKNNNSFGITLHLQGLHQCSFLEDTNVSHRGWSITSVGRFCSSAPRQPQLLPFLGSSCLLLLLLLLTIITTPDTTFPCLHLFFFCNFYESFKSRSGFSL